MLLIEYNVYRTECVCGGGGGELKAGFQQLVVITNCKLDSVMLSGVCGCRCVELIWTCLVWAEQSTSDSSWVQSHQLNSATGEQK